MTASNQVTRKTMVPHKGLQALNYAEPFEKLLFNKCSKLAWSMRRVYIVLSSNARIQYSPLLFQTHQYGYRCWQLDMMLVILSVRWEWLMPWYCSAHICWKIRWWFFKERPKNPQQPSCLSLWLPRFFFCAGCIIWVSGSEHAWGVKRMMRFL